MESLDSSVISRGWCNTVRCGSSDEMLTRGDVEQNTRPLGDSIWPRWDGM
jgi:hypothetical protein